MEATDKKYLLLILLHVSIGIAVYYISFLSKVYGFSIILGGIYFVINSQNRNNEVLYAAAYIVGSEAILRMTNGNPIYEFSKYGVIIFMLIGFYYKGLSKNALPYWFFLILLVPGIFIATQTINYDSDLQNKISFSISGPICLGICSLYCYTRQITFKQLNTVLLAAGLPVITTTVYLVLYTPSIKDVLTGTGSNFAASGGFGPNQVATILGLGMFVFVSRLIYNSPTLFLFISNLVLVASISYRGLITFSRGGMITGLLMLILLIFTTYTKINSKIKGKMNFLIFGILLSFLAIWFYSSQETSGLIDKRYANQDAAGRVKEDQFTGRGEIAENEIELFLQNPIFGVGVGKASELRKEITGEFILSHSEITRMLAEHGSIGILALMILFVTPIILYIDNKHNVYILSFIVFWFLTVNHAAMRLAAPAFIYSLSLLKVILDEK